MPPKMSKDLANIQTQVKSCKTRGSNPRLLSPEEITDLERQRDSLKAQLAENAKNLITAEANTETTRQ